MKFTLLAVMCTLFFVSTSHAGSDDRDQELLLNSLNTEQNIDEDAVPRFLQEDDEVIQDEEIEQGQKEIEELIQIKLEEQEIVNNSQDKRNLDLRSRENGKLQIFFNQYVKSEQGILLILILFVIAIILIFSFFVR